MAILSTKDLKKVYGSGENEVHALAGVNFQVEKGEFVFFSRHITRNLYLSP